MRLLGGFEVRTAKKAVHLPSRSAQSLFAFLILNSGTAHRRERLAGLLWPEVTEENARVHLRHALWHIRKALQSVSSASYLQADDLTIAFNASSDYWLDAAVLRDADDEGPAEVLMEALSAYKGELLPGFYEDWVLLEREHLQRTYEHKMGCLLDLLHAADRPSDVLDWAEKWIAWGQKPEAAYRALMMAYAALGDGSKAAATYERCARALAEYGLEPSATTIDLYQKLKSGVGLVRSDHAASELRRSEEGPSPGSIPELLTSFVGRQNELREIEGLLSTARILTLSGFGGIGKTRLAIQVAQRMRGKFRDGTYWVELASISDSSLVPQAIARSLDIRELPNQALSEALRQYLAPRKALLVLDNCERLVSACASLAELLAAACPNLKILATSREALGVMGETLYHVPTLSLPPSEASTTADLSLTYEAVRLFVDRAHAVRPGFELTQQNVTAVHQICLQLDGIPLAVELAAARTKILSVDHIAARLNDRFSLLTQGRRTALPRQQTLRATIDWSYDVLSQDAKVLFQRLSVFAGGFTLEAAERICSEDPLTPRGLLDVLGRLADRSLLEYAHKGADVRYRFLESIREYALEKCADSGQIDHLRSRHREYYVALAEQAEPKLKGPEQFAWADVLESEHENLRATWDHAVGGDAKSALRLASALLDYWSMRGNPAEGRKWLAQLLQRTEQWDNPVDAAHVLSLAGRLAYLQRDYPAARGWLQEALAVARSSGDQKEISFALLWLAWTAHRQRDDVVAEPLAEESLAAYRRLQDPWGIAMALYHLAGIAASRGRYEEAEDRYRQSLDGFQALGDRFRMGYALNGLGELGRLRGDYEQARQYYDEHIGILRKQRSGVALLIPLVNQAWVSLYAGAADKARMLFAESLDLSNEYGNKTVVADCLAGFAALAGTTGKAEVAARLFGAAEALMENLGMGGRRDPADQKEYDRYVSAVRQQLDAVSFARLWSQGRALTPEAAAAFALQETQGAEAFLPQQAKHATAGPRKGRIPSRNTSDKR